MAIKESVLKLFRSISATQAAENGHMSEIAPSKAQHPEPFRFENLTGSDPGFVQFMKVAAGEADESTLEDNPWRYGKDRQVELVLPIDEYKAIQRYLESEDD